jgi:RND family efflux transporter MFP subunit
MRAAAPVFPNDQGLILEGKAPTVVEQKKKPQLGLLKRPHKKGEWSLWSEIISRCLNQDTLEAAAIHLVNELAHNLQCERVSLGLRSGNRVRLVAISNHTGIDQKANLIQAMADVMAETMDADDLIYMSETQDEARHAVLAHRQFIRAEGPRAVCSLPLAHGTQGFGAILLERESQALFSERDMTRLKAVADICGPALHLLQREERRLHQRFSEALRDRFMPLLGPRHTLKKITAIGLAALLVSIGFLDVDYRVTANASVQGSIQRVIVSPVDGYIASAAKRAGDTVGAGELIATLDDKDLKLEALKWQTQHQKLQREYRESLAKYDRAQISILNARIKQAEAQLELVNEQLSRLRIVAPFEGLIVEGELERAIGAPVSRGDTLFKLVPKEGHRIILEVDEREIARITDRQTGILSLASLPSEALQLSVSKITPVSSAKDGRNVFLVEADLHGSNDKLRPGMQGIAKITVGERNLLWILSHKLMERIRLLLWSVWP